MNSWEREELLPNLDDEAFVLDLQRCLNNCRPRDRRPSTVYDDAVLHVMLPLLIKRFMRLKTMIKIAFGDVIAGHKRSGRTMSSKNIVRMLENMRRVIDEEASEDCARREETRVRSHSAPSSRGN